jgi:lysophospholipase L1-like esterase
MGMKDPRPHAALRSFSMASRYRTFLIVSLALNGLFLIATLAAAAYFNFFAIARRYRDRAALKYVGASSIYRNRQDVFEGLPSLQGKTVFVGDSLTSECEWHELFPGVPVVNRGIYGDTTHGVSDRIGSIARQSPAQVFLMIGINDLLNGTNVPGTVALCGDVLATLRKQAPEAEVWVQSLLPVSGHQGDFPVGAEQVRAFNASLRRIADEHGCRFLDLYAEFAGPDGSLDPRFSFDGLHLNREGYLRWAEQLKPHLRSPSSP